MVHRGVKFSCRFTVQELQQRWYALLYDPIVSRVAVAAMRNLHPEVAAAVQSKALYSKAEEELLGTIKSVRVIPDSCDSLRRLAFSEQFLYFGRPLNQHKRLCKIC